jgi:hypothetical protein
MKSSDKEYSMDQSHPPLWTDYDLAKLHFELKVKANDTYTQNSSSGTAGRNKYESANNMADISDEIKDYITKIASKSITNDNVVGNMLEADKIFFLEKAEISTQIKQLTANVAKLASRSQKNTMRTTIPTKTVVAAETGLSNR